MATVVLQNAIAPPAGSRAQYSATIGSLTKISGVQHTSFGRFLSKTANGAAGGVPVAGFQRFTIFSPSASFLPTYSEIQYSPAASPIAPVGTTTEYSAAIGSQTKISGVQHTTLGRFPHAIRGILAPALMGRLRYPLNGTWLISTPGSTPAVQLPAGMIVSVSCCRRHAARSPFHCLCQNHSKRFYMEDRQQRLNEVARICPGSRNGCPARLMIAQWALESQWGALKWRGSSIH
jgi:hypothetical protein